MKKLLLLLCCIFTLLAAQTATAQNQPKPKAKPATKPTTSTTTKPTTKPTTSDSIPTTKRNKPIEVQVFDRNESEKKYIGRDKYSPDNVISFVFTDWIEGSFPFTYERVLASHLSASVGVGFTITNDFYAPFRTSIYSTGQDGDYDNLVKGGTGLMYKVGVQYYLTKYDYAPEGWHLGLEYQVKQYQFTAYPIDPTSGQRQYSRAFKPTTITNTDQLRLIIGYQVITRNDLTFDFYMGLDYRKSSFEGETYDQQTQVYASKGTTETSRPVFIIGCKYGISF